MEHSEYREEIPHGDHPASYDHAEPRYKSIGIIMGVTVILLIVVGIGIQAYYEITYTSEEYRRVLSQENWNLRDLRNKEEWELTRYGYVDQNKGTVRIPIDQAIEMVARDAAENRPQYPTNSYPVKTPEQLAAAVPPVSQAGAAAANAGQNEGVKSNPDVQPPAPQSK